jgi:uncharacterized protein (DUF1697 family)
MPGGTQYVALLRGVNVGGKNRLPMAELRAAAEGMGLEDVATYIASGNLLFRAPRQASGPLASRLETELSAAFAMDLKVVLLTAAQLRRVVESAPRGFGAKSDKCDVIFLRKPLTPKRALSVVELREGVDRAWSGPGVLYFSRVAAKASRSRLSKVVATPEYKDMTIRSWSSATKLLALVDSRS